MSSAKPVLGVFGGTFDPVHLGHLNAVLEVTSVFQFARVQWVLSARPPHKDQVSASIAERYAMLELALEPWSEFYPDDTEIRRQAKSYTYDTIQQLRKRFPDHRLCMIIGADSLLKLPTWHRWLELIEEIDFIVMARPGYKLDVPAEMRAHVVTSPEQLFTDPDSGIYIFEQTSFAVSSTRIRDALAARMPSSSNEFLSQWLPSTVLDYINQQQSYKLDPMTPEQIKDQVVNALEDIKGQDIRVLDIGDISDFTDYMVVASGTSDTHVKALAREASDSLRSQGVKPLNEDGADVGEWVLVDFGDVVLHVMRPEVREYYDIEKLWDEDVRELLKQHHEQGDSQDQESAQ